MNDSVRIGPVGGVRVGLHWSLLAMVVLVTVGLANSRFPYDAPGHSGTAYALAALGTAVGLLVGVLLHELGHAFVARRRGLTVQGITLGWMGGITRLEGETATPGTELSVAGIGPLTSAAVGGLFFLARTLASSAGADPLWLSALGWLAWINLFLAGFNLLPAAPLDGGRVLHSLVWFAWRDRWRATRVASGAGVVLGGAVVVVGLVISERTGNLFNGLLVGFIGWWMVASARGELDGAAVHRALDGVRLVDVMRPVGEAPGWITVRAFVEQYARHRPGWVWLLREWNGGYRGLALGDVVATVPYPQWDLARPLDVSMPLTAVGAAAPGDDPLTALARARDRRIILVVADGHTVGAVLPSDIEALVRMRGRGQRLPWRRATPGPVR